MAAILGMNNSTKLEYKLTTFNIQTWGHSGSRHIAKTLNNFPNTWAIHMGRQRNQTIFDYLNMISSQSTLYEHVGTIGGIQADELDLLPDSIKTVWLERHPIDRINSALGMTFKNGGGCDENLLAICWLLVQNINRADLSRTFKIEDLNSLPNFHTFLEVLNTPQSFTDIHAMRSLSFINDSWNTERIDFCAKMPDRIRQLIPSDVWQKYETLGYEIPKIYQLEN